MLPCAFLCPPPHRNTPSLKITTSASSQLSSVTSSKHTPPRNKLSSPTAYALSHDFAPWSMHTLNLFLPPPLGVVGWWNQPSANMSKPSRVGGRYAFITGSSRIATANKSTGSVDADVSPDPEGEIPNPSPDDASSAPKMYADAAPIASSPAAAARTSASKDLCRNRSISSESRLSNVGWPFSAKPPGVPSKTGGSSGSPRVDVSCVSPVSETEPSDCGSDCSPSDCSPSDCGSD
mmetsp:Transcript_6024/g.20012  ORF Transcript_6024/g.20012 Transcript_6024/m.20012 type:complete len:235 (+) Transcript_6024:1922-2626(+)